MRGRSTGVRMACGWASTRSTRLQGPRDRPPTMASETHGAKLVQDSKGTPLRLHPLRHPRKKASTIRCRTAKYYGPRRRRPWPRSPLPPFVEPHPAPRLHSSRLDRRVGILQPEPECVVVRVAEVGVGLSLEGGELGCDLCKVSGYVLDGVGVVPGSGDWVLAHPLRVPQGRQIP